MKQEILNDFMQLLKIWVIAKLFVEKSSRTDLFFPRAGRQEKEEIKEVAGRHVLVLYNIPSNPLQHFAEGTKTWGSGKVAYKSNRRGTKNIR